MMAGLFEMRTQGISSSKNMRDFSAPEDMRSSIQPDIGTTWLRQQFLKSMLPTSEKILYEKLENTCSSTAGGLWSTKSGEMVMNDGTDTSTADIIRPMRELRSHQGETKNTANALAEHEKKLCDSHRCDNK